MTTEQLTAELLKQGYAVHFGPMPGFMGLHSGKCTGFAWVIDAPDGERYTKHLPDVADLALSLYQFMVDKKLLPESILCRAKVVTSSRYAIGGKGYPPFDSRLADNTFGRKSP